MGDTKNIFLPVIENIQIEKLNLALKQVIREVGQKEANVIVTNVEDCMLYSMEINSLEADIKTLDFLCDSLTSKILGLKSKKCFTNVIGKKKDGIDILSFREICLDMEE